MSPNVLKEISAIAGQKKWRSDLRPGKKEMRQEIYHEGGKRFRQKGNSTQYI